jgi:NTF2 fold immunity protein
MSRRKLAVAFLIFGLLPIALFVIWQLWEIGKGPLAVGPSKANFERLRTGMTLAEVEEVLGPAGLSYSSDSSYEYYIWKGKDGWSRVWVRQSTVYKLSFDPTLSSDPRLTEEQVLAMAEPALNATMSPEYVSKYKPYRAEIREGVWKVFGSLPGGSRGGTPEARVRDSDGKVLEVFHSQ